MEVDLPRMQSLSPHFDTPATTDMSAMTNLTDFVPFSELEPEPKPVLQTSPESIPSSFSMEDAKNGDWNFFICGCNRSGCGCKYINKVSDSVFHIVFL